ncbi:MAG TPA: UDP-N-acetylenolpyruvoylglucosamine reductase, partial [Stellaceae bacterium]|nr:UDP-N-acetylenolpyruvoylglucosamine reductase [Stellaceae bacterium]
MMALRRDHTPRLIDRLPRVRGRLTENAPLAQLTWFRVGGSAEVMFRPADFDDLAEFLAAKPKDVTLTVMGVASNLLIRDGGVPGVVIRLGRGFVDVAASGDEITAGAGALD